MNKNTTSANGAAISDWEDEGGAGRPVAVEPPPCAQAEDLRPEEERRDKRADDTVPCRPNDEVPANRRDDPRSNGRDQDVERKDRRSSS